MKKVNSREKLISLEKQGKFVFHGSTEKIKELETKQPYTFDQRTRKQKKHGKACVSATPYVEIAIFRAIINSKNFPKNYYASSFGVNRNNTIRLATTKLVLQKSKDKKGFVYILEKSLFNKFSGMEWRAYKNIKPIEVISVTEKDLPQNIQLIDKDFNKTRSET